MSISRCVYSLKWAYLAIDNIYRVTPNMNNDKIVALPTNVITGFLGAGKTSAIVHLLKQKPADERWAVLVNEFGEIGVDGSLIAGQLGANKDIFIREVPGGCMCCLSGLPMQIALNKLLHEAKPHRLLIEPTGLGHPLEVIQVLSNQYYQKALNLEKTITLVDARQLADSRYTEHTIFNQQIEIADVIVGSKLDLYQQPDKEALITYLQDQPFTPKETVFIEHGQLPLKLLSGTTRYKVIAKQHQHNQQSPPATDKVDFPKSGFIRAMNEGEGFVSIGWRFAPEKVFDRMKLHAFLTDIEVTRVKAVFITSQGIYGYNTANDGAVEVTLDECNESRIEIICTQIDENWQQALLNCINK